MIAALILLGVFVLILILSNLRVNRGAKDITETAAAAGFVVEDIRDHFVFMRKK